MTITLPSRRIHAHRARDFYEREAAASGWAKRTHSQVPQSGHLVFFRMQYQQRGANKEKVHFIIEGIEGNPIYMRSLWLYRAQGQKFAISRDRDMKYFNATHSIVAIVLVTVFLGTAFDAQANAVEQRFIDAGLVDVHSIDPTIQVDLVNSDPQKNYFRENFYNGLTKAYLRKEVATKLSKAQTLLKSKHPDFSLQILDAARPNSVSKKMYAKMKGTKFEKFVADPAKGSMHNYGIALDITIIDGTGNELDMGFSPFRKSDTEIYWQFAKMKLGIDLTEAQTKNRQLLSNTMKRAGFLPLSHEWWHFDGMPKEVARQQFKIIE